MEGNELADKYPKKATSKENIDVDIKYSKAEVKSIIKEKVQGKWQHLWENGSSGRHLFNIQPVVSKISGSVRMRREEVILARLRIGHTSLNSSLALISKHDSGNCEHCQARSMETVEHVLVHCQNYHHERQTLIAQVKASNTTFGLKQLLHRSAGKIYSFLFVFLRSTGLIKRI